MALMFNHNPWYTKTLQLLFKNCPFIFLYNMVVSIPTVFMIITMQVSESFFCKNQGTNIKCSEASSGVNLAFFNTWTTSSLLRVIKTHRHLSFSLLMRFGTFLGIFLLEYKALYYSCILEFQMLIQIWVYCLKQ